MDENTERDRILAVKAKYEEQLLRKRNVIGVGVGLRQRNGEWTDELVLTVLVRRKRPWHVLRARDRIPDQLDGVPVDVQEVGNLAAL
ncbi:MAG: hypothetical protein JXA09_07010 [Anaerolineae bacterium]|nr:hypothetical protein [Anaerolineae bacterium]